eukprot:CAMPEP_0175672744 /NCGR_PEP_ID=MMETSP0097-20121207/20848_1 /TAXON_ID=311494 /ORGANISM="Alexandrium monilatum, Strain CCMP3105" /LENGTH=69 /DNA_ID=CAMNT_0016979389 /DNA_START=49 /DNA_END=254 /DNA_ORIENTATION=-
MPSCLRGARSAKAPERRPAQAQLAVENGLVAEGGLGVVAALGAAPGEAVAPAPSKAVQVEELLGAPAEV